MVRNKQQPPRPSDDDMARYLASLELSSLDLSDINLDQPPRGRGPLIASGLALLTNSAALAFIPTTAWYVLNPAGHTTWLVVLALEPLLGWWAARSLRAGAAARPSVNERAAGRRAPSRALPASSGAEGEGANDADALTAIRAGLAMGDEAEEAEPAEETLQAAVWAVITSLVALQQHWWQHWWQHKLAPILGQALRYVEAHKRAFLALGIVGAGLLLAFGLPQDPQWSGKTYSGLWFVAVGVALTCGILVGRFVVAAGEAARAADQGPAPTLTLPPWFRYVSLALLIGGGLVATFGPSLMSDSGLTSGFPFASVGFGVGICGAIWLVKRFDEWEQDFAREAARKQPPQAPPKVAEDAENH